MTLELPDIQGLVARGYGNLRAAAFLLLSVEDSEAARRWVAEVGDRVTRGDDRPDERALNIAFTSSGLERLGVARDLLQLFSNEFVTGMTTPHRTRILADLGENSPSQWDWGGPQSARVDALLLLYAQDEAGLAALEEDELGRLGGGLALAHRLGTADLDGIEPFGFRDGVSQPYVEGLSKTGPPESTVRAGEFVLGYLNEYGLYTDRQLLEASPDLARNGTYLVVRQLHQDVSGFWRFLDSVTSSAEERLRLAAKMVGRWPSGAPLVVAPDADDPARAEANDFAYHDQDRRGVRCPVGSHIRRANPRDSLDPRPGTDDSFAVNRRHRLLRRGREYGPPLSLEQALAGDDGGDRGIHFICLNANIARQFEFVNHTWLNNAKFDRLYDDADPLVGPSEPYGGTFTIPTEGVRERVTKVPRFVTVKGGAYFFLPGLAGLRSLSSL